MSATSAQNVPEQPVTGERTVPLVGPTGVEVPGRVMEFGEGVPFVFLHGLVGINEHWLGVVRRVSDRIRCVLLEVPLLELRGDDCCIQGVSAMVARFVREQLRTPSVLVGSSFGGHVALRLGVYDPDLVRGLVLVGSSGLGEKPIGGPRVKRTREWMEETIAELFFDRSKMPAGDVDRAWGELSERTKAKRLFRLSRSVFADSMGDRLSSIRAPTLVLWGREDQITPPEAAEQFASEIPGAELVWIDECGHAPMIEKPEEFSRALLAFGERIGCVRS